MGDNHEPIWPFYASIGLGILYITTGFVYILSGFGLFPVLPASNEIIGSFMLPIVGVVYLVGVQHFKTDRQEGFAFLVVATALAAVLFVLHTIVFGTNALGSFLGLDDWIGWTPLDNFSPGIWLFAIVLVIIGGLKMTGRLGGEKGIFPLEV